jgi:hypothetical protein
LVAGWGRVERAGPQRFRWTRAPVAELLAPLAVEGPMQMEITASPAAGPGTLRVRAPARHSSLMIKCERRRDCSGRLVRSCERASNRARRWKRKKGSTFPARPWQGFSLLLVDWFQNQLGCTRARHRCSWNTSRARSRRTAPLHACCASRIAAPRIRSLPRLRPRKGPRGGTRASRSARSGLRPRRMRSARRRASTRHVSPPRRCGAKDGRRIVTLRAADRRRRISSAPVRRRAG